MRVLCVNDLPPGGAGGTEVHLELLLEGLLATGDEARCFSRPPRTGPAKALDAWDPRARAALEREVESFRPDVLHFHNVTRELSVAVLLAAPSLPRVITVHDGRLLGDADGRSSPLRALQRARARWDRHVTQRSGATLVAVSSALASRLSRAGLGPVVTSWLWAEPPAGPVTSPTDSRDIAFVGRVDTDKGVDVLVDAFLRADRPGARLLLAGTGTAQVVADPRVVRLGRLGRREVSGLLGSARCLALPSRPERRPEGAPLALIEGLVHGRPVLVSDDPGCREIARIDTPRPAGLCVPSGDVDALAQALGRILDDDGLVSRLAAGADAAAAEHTPQAGLARVRAAYAQALS
ncbi:MAG: glycosyl transferase group 1 [Frankiales bacterium]|nr:glycosyl transferase group 1 [Frankiales bacterium]